MNKILFYTYKSSLFQKALVKYSFTNKKLVQDLYCLFTVGDIIKCLGPINRIKTDFILNFNYSPIPNNFNTNLSFEDVSLTVAEEIWKNNNSISLFWSGGIDSTTSLSSLIMTNSNWKNDIEIYTTMKAIDIEYPLFYDKFLKNCNVRIMEFNELYDKKLYDNKFVIDGNLGDWLWSCGLAKTFGLRYNDHYELFFDSVEFKKQQYKIILRQYIEEMISLSPVPIKTVFDLCWWLAFTHRWDYTKMIHESCIHDVNYINSSHSFFDHELFQCWSMSNMDKKIKDNWKTYKWPAKDLIYKLTGDNDYRLNKEQTNSIFHPISRRIITTNGITNKESTDQEAFETCINLQSV